MCFLVKGKERNQEEATLAVVLLCARFYMHSLIHKSPEKNGTDLGGQGPISQRRKFQH